MKQGVPTSFKITKKTKNSWKCNGLHILKQINSNFADLRFSLKKLVGTTVFSQFYNLTRFHTEETQHLLQIHNLWLQKFFHSILYSRYFHWVCHKPIRNLEAAYNCHFHKWNMPYGKFVPWKTFALHETLLLRIWDILDLELLGCLKRPWIWPLWAHFVYYKYSLIYHVILSKNVTRRDLSKTTWFMRTRDLDLFQKT